MQTPKTKLNLLTLTIALGMILFTGNSVVVTRAEDPPPAQNQTPAATDPQAAAQQVVCKYEMREYIATELPKFRDFIDQHFQNKSSTASLLDSAFGKYEEFRKKLMDKMEPLLPQAGADILVAGGEPGECVAQTNMALEEAQSFIMRKAQMTSAVKTTTALIDKYKEINDKLANLNKTFSNLKNYMDKFAKKVPCYIKDKCNAK